MIAMARPSQYQSNEHYEQPTTFPNTRVKLLQLLAVGRKTAVWTGSITPEQDILMKRL
jgi:hypothetical protein